MKKFIYTSHVWGHWPDSLFLDVEMAATELARFCRKWGRFSGQAKEKFGQVRFYASMHSYLDLWELWTGGYHFYKGPAWFHPINNFICFRVTVPFDLLGTWRAFIYRLAYAVVLVKYPHIYNEILSGASHLELLGAEPVVFKPEEGVEDEQHAF